jgi:hypothetical protein
VPEAIHSIQERKLATRLSEIQKSEAKVKQLKRYDIHDLLPSIVALTESVEDIFLDDDL